MARQARDPANDRWAQLAGLSSLQSFTVAGRPAAGWLAEGRSAAAERGNGPSSPRGKASSAAMLPGCRPASTTNSTRKQRTNSAGHPACLSRNPSASAASARTCSARWWRSRCVARSMCSSCSSPDSALTRCLQMRERQANRCCSSSGSRSSPAGGARGGRGASQAQHSRRQLITPTPTTSAHQQSEKGLHLRQV